MSLHIAYFHWALYYWPMPVTAQSLQPLTNFLHVAQYGFWKKLEGRKFWATSGKGHL